MSDPALHRLITEALDAAVRYGECRYRCARVDCTSEADLEGAAATLRAYADRAQPLHEHAYAFEPYCGAHVCDCGDHRGLARCFCGWSRTSPGRGREELVEMGETIEEDE